MGRPPKLQTGKKAGALKKSKRFSATPISQGKHTLYSFTERASELWKYVSINRRTEDKDDGYQRVLSNRRVRDVADYINEGNIIPGSIIIAIDDGKFDKASGKLRVSKGKDVAWVIDGQHRLAGAHLASQEGNDIELNVVALLDMDDQAQIEQFVTINREGKNVPTSLYLDLLKHLPKQKSTSELAAERAADIATEMRRDKNSIFYGRIVVTTSPGRGQISIVNFVRKVTPYVNPEKGLLNNCTLAQQTTILENYFSAIRKCFGDEWRSEDSIFFKTIGFGALMNVFDDIFKECTVQGEGFRVSDVTEALDLVKSFDFSQWSAMGSGNKAEMDAAREFQVDFARAVAKRRSVGGTAKQLRL